MKSFAAELVQDFASLFYPKYCLACSNGLVKGEENICTKCILELPRTDFHLDKHNPLFEKLNGRIKLQSAFSFLWFIKNGRVQQLLHELKYRSHPELGVTLGLVYGTNLTLAKIEEEIDIIIPVPLHSSKFRKRGYNQSEEFAKGLSRALQRPIIRNALVRPTKTETQTRKNKLKRWENVNDVFEVMNDSEIKDQRILLVDDVITTGATVEACSDALFAAGCRSISLVSIAFTEA